MISIDQAIAASQRRSRKLWLVSIVWTGVMITVALAFGISIYQFNETRSQVNELKKTAYGLIADLRATRDELSLLQRTGSAQGRQLYALRLQQLGSDKLTPAQKEFIKREAAIESRETPSPESLTVQAYSERIEGKYQNSYDIYTEALTLNSDYSPAYAGRSGADTDLGDFAAAISDLTHALTLEKDVAHRPDLLILRAQALIRMSRFAEAEQDLSAASNSANLMTKSSRLNISGLMRLKQKNWQEAERNFRDAANVNPEMSSMYMDNIGLIYLATSDWTKAYQWSSHISEDPMNLSWWIWMIRSISAEKLGKPTEQKKSLEMYLARAPDPKRDIDDLSFFLPGDLAQLARSWVLSAKDNVLGKN
ncbi:MAG TPA: hypothetical protein VGF34_17180 [Stellaceae bacterium]|jgi:tetratricopeptide (TPR) repeat protein